MDKFIQVPLQLPDPSGAALGTYKQSLLQAESRKDLAAIYSRAFSGLDVKDNDQTAKDKLHSFAAENKLNDNEKDELIKEFSTRTKINDRFSTFESNSAAVCDYLISKLPPFLSNPRDLKRCINATKFSYFFSDAPVTRDGLQLLACRVILSIRWPAVIRFLRQLAKDPGEGRTDAGSLNKKIEEFKFAASHAGDFADWKIKLSSSWSAPPGTNWIEDRQLYLFLSGGAAVAASAT
jgi:hypothetical protein